jgi:hypothetical protein
VILLSFLSFPYALTCSLPEISGGSPEKTQSTLGRCLLLQKPVRFLIDGISWTYGNDFNDSFRCYLVDDSEAANLKALEPSEFVPERFAGSRFRGDNTQPGS